MKHETSRSLTQILIFSLILALSVAHAQTPQDAVNQYISQLQSNPGDTSLREKIINLVLTMKPKPAIPNQALAFEGAAEYAFKNAKTESDFAEAAKEYEKALLVAPWMAADYFNCGVAYESSKQFDAAIRNFNLYLIAAPDAPDANAVRKRIGGLKYAMEKAGQEQQAAQAQARAEQERREAPKKLLARLKSQYDGASYSVMWCSYASQDTCFANQMGFPCGCNEADLGGSHWYDAESFTFKISFPTNETILFSYFWMGRNYLALRGTPKGPNIDDIVWEENKTAGSNTIQWEPCWVRLINGLDKLMYSPSGIEGKRPVDESQYSAYARYNYRILKR